MKVFQSPEERLWSSYSMDAVKQLPLPLYRIFCAFVNARSELVRRAIAQSLDIQSENQLLLHVSDTVSLEFTVENSVSPSMVGVRLHSSVVTYPLHALDELLFENDHALVVNAPGPVLYYQWAQLLGGVSPIPLLGQVSSSSLPEGVDETSTYQVSLLQVCEAVQMRLSELPTLLTLLSDVVQRRVPRIEGNAVTVLSAWYEAAPSQDRAKYVPSLAPPETLKLTMSAGFVRAEVRIRAYAALTRRGAPQVHLLRAWREARLPSSTAATSSSGSENSDAVCMHNVGRANATIVDWANKNCSTLGERLLVVAEVVRQLNEYFVGQATIGAVQARGTSGASVPAFHVVSPPSLLGGVDDVDMQS
jgi:hypothetical protein